MRAAKAGKNIPKSAQRSISLPTVAKNSQVFKELSKAAKTWRKIAQSCQSLAKVAKKIAKSCQRIPKVAKQCQNWQK